ncbi:MAG: glycosyltransferase [Candidatus Gracilibacteria bacterium]|nr:glycosyltransferase [Candidatus Gracilibacteria bacterium]
MKIAILHEMLIKLGGAEKVVENWMNLFPDADIFTLIYDENKVGKIFPKNKINKQVFSLKTQKIYSLTKKQRFCLPFMSRSVESLDFSDYDLVLCSSSGFAHGAITKPETKFIVYYHSPARYIWDWTNEYKADLGLNSGWKNYILKPLINKMFLKIRIWDFIASNRVDISIANSKNTAKRIEKYYRKDSILLYPPIETNRFSKRIKKIESNWNNKPFENNNYYIIISALTEFKKLDIAIKTFNNLEENLLIIGAGNYKEELEKLVEKNNISFVGAKYNDELVYLVQNSLGLIFPGEEDFGIVPIEVMAAGKPVFAYNAGGLTETVLAGVTGEFFDKKDGSDFIEKFKIFHTNNLENKYKTENCEKQASLFSKEIFEKRLKEIIKQ